MIEDTQAIKAAIDIGSMKIKEVEHIARAAKLNSTSSEEIDEYPYGLKDPPTPYEQNNFSYDDVPATSRYMNEMMAPQESFQQQHHQSSSPPRDQDMSSQYNYPTPSREQLEQQQRQQQQQQQQSNAPFYSNNMQPAMYHHYQQNQSSNNAPDPPVEALQRLKELQDNAQFAEREANSAQDHVQALAIQYNDLRMQAERAEIIANEIRPKKKGFFKGGKKEAVSAQFYLLLLLYVKNILILINVLSIEERK